MLFQEREFLIKHGHKVIDFSMDHPENFPSKYSDYFVRNVDYVECSKDGKSISLLARFRTAVDFIHNRQATNSLKALIEREKPDIAHLHNIYHQITASIIPVLKNAGVKVVLTLHDYKLVCPAYSMINEAAICNKCKGKNFGQATVRRCQDRSYFRSLLLSIEGYWHRIAKTYDCVDLFLCPSNFMADMVGRYRIGREKIRILRNGIDIERYTASGEDGGYALYFGRISEEKGIETLLEAHRLLSNKLHLKVVGNGPRLPKLKKWSAGVEFTGYKTGEELKDLIKRASYVVVPSKWHENCSMSVLESMAYGKPVLGSRVGGIPDQIEDGKTGLLFEMGNSKDLAEKMRLLAQNRHLRREMGKAAREKLEREYSLSGHCAKLIKTYNDLLQ